MLWPASVLLLPLLGLAQTSGPAQGSSSYKIAGVVVDSTNGQPLSAANVSIYGSENRELAWHVTTASDGRFLFSALPAGKYTLTTIPESPSVRRAFPFICAMLIVDGNSHAN